MADQHITEIPRDRKPGEALRDAVYREMQSARRSFLRAWRAWLLTNPASGEVGDEVDSTLSAFRQIIELGGPRS